MSAPVPTRRRTTTRLQIVTTAKHRKGRVPRPRPRPRPLLPVAKTAGRGMPSAGQHQSPRRCRRRRRPTRRLAQPRLRRTRPRRRSRPGASRHASTSGLQRHHPRGVCLRESTRGALPPAGPARAPPVPLVLALSVLARVAPALARPARGGSLAPRHGAKPQPGPRSRPAPLAPHRVNHLPNPTPRHPPPARDGTRGVRPQRPRRPRPGASAMRCPSGCSLVTERAQV